MRIKSFIAVAVLATAVLCFGATVSAQSDDWCHTFTKNLGYKDSGTSEVGYLHTALDKEGFSYFPDTGDTYYEGTMNAVKLFQRKYGIAPARGYFGTSTRLKMNELYGCSCTPDWDCTEWSTCSNGIQRKTCTDLNSCGTIAQKPSEVQTCQMPAKNCGFVGNYNSDIANSKYTATSEECKNSFLNWCPTWTGGRVFYNNELVYTCAGPELVVTAYSNVNYGATAASGTAASYAVGSYTATQMRAKGTTNNSISSVKVAPGYKVTFYAGDNFGGAVLVKTENDPTLANDRINSVYDWNDEVSSMKVERVEPTITVTSPNGGETWRIGETHNITWTTSGIPNGHTVTFQLLTESGEGNTNVYADSLPNNGPYTWTIPDSILPGRYKVAIFDPTPGSTLIGNLVIGQSNIFTIAEPAQKSITITSPATGAEWVTNTTQTITWDSTDVDYVKVQVIDQSGAVNDLVTNLQASIGGYAWVVDRSFPLGTGYAIKVSDQSDPSISATLPFIIIATPAKNCRFLGTYNEELANTPSVYQASSDECISHWATKSRCATWTGGRVFYNNEVVYTCPGSELVVTVYSKTYYQGTGASYAVGSYNLAQMQAKGTKNDSISSVKVAPGYKVTFYRAVNFGGATLVKTENDPTFTDDRIAGTTRYNWDDEASSMKVERVEVSAYHCEDLDHDYKISGTEFNRIAAYWRAGAYHVDPAGADGYASGTGSHNGAYNCADYNHNWVIDNAEYQRVETYFNTGCYVVEPNGYDGFANCTVQPTIKITSPVDGATLTSKTLTVSGTCSNYSGSMDVYYYSDKREDKQIDCTNGIWSTVITINSNATSGSFDLYAQAMGDASALDKIKLRFNWPYTQPSITVTSPNGGETWKVGETHNITWTSSRITNVSINLNKPGATLALTTNRSASSGSYSWTIPSSILPGDSYYIQIIGDGATISNGNVFSIAVANPTQPTIKITSPVDGATLTSKTLTVSGTCSNYSGSMDVYYYSDKREDKQIDCTNGIWSTVITINSNATSGSFDLYAQAMGDASALDKIKLRFNWPYTQPSITVTSPNGGESYNASAWLPFQFTTENIARGADYKAELVNSNSQKWEIFSGSTSFGGDSIGAGGSVNLSNLTPKLESGNYKVFISITVDGTVIQDISDNYFTISEAEVRCPGYLDNYVVLNSMQYSNGTVSFNLTNTTSLAQTVSISIDSGSVSQSSITVPSGTCASPNSITYSASSNATITFTNSGSVIASLPVPATTTGCTDTDGGKDYFVRGTVTNQTGSSTDLCYTTDKRIAEYYCSPEGGRVYEWHDCPNGCSNGACIQTSSLAPNNNPVAQQSILNSMIASLANIAEQIKSLLAR